jgi:hypothetical protein
VKPYSPEKKEIYRKSQRQNPKESRAGGRFRKGDRATRAAGVPAAATRQAYAAAALFDGEAERLRRRAVAAKRKRKPQQKA